MWVAHIFFHILKTSPRMLQCRSEMKNILYVCLEWLIVIILGLFLVSTGCHREEASGLVESDQPWVQRQAAPAAPTQGRLSGTSYISLFKFWDLPYKNVFAAALPTCPELGCCASHWPLTAAPASTARGVWRWTSTLSAPSLSRTTPTLTKRLMR